MVKNKLLIRCVITDTVLEASSYTQTLILRLYQNEPTAVCDTYYFAIFTIASFPSHSNSQAQGLGQDTAVK